MLLKYFIYYQDVTEPQHNWCENNNFSENSTALDWDFSRCLRRLRVAIPPTVPEFYATKISSFSIFLKYSFLGEIIQAVELLKCQKSRGTSTRNGKSCLVLQNAITPDELMNILE